MILGILCFLSLFLALRLIITSSCLKGEGYFKGHGEREGLQRVAFLFREIEETLGAGLIPEEEKWMQVQWLPPPWGGLASSSLQDLRSSGGALLPTLQRLRVLAENHRTALLDARARSSQATAQALGCAGLVPVFGSILYFLLPGVEEFPRTWIAGCSMALLASGAGAIWLFSMAEAARWGGLRPQERSWMLAAQCGGERFLSLVRSGCPPDLAWTRSCEYLSQHAPGLVGKWGFSLWAPHRQSDKNLRPGALCTLIQLGDGLKRAVQQSLMEGRPCLDRVSTALEAMRADFRAHVERELSLLGTRALKPLFFFVAPSLMGLIALSLFLCWKGVGSF